jgi:IS30 family transposase
VIGHALAAKAAGAGFRTIATRLGRPPSTVRRWLRRAPERHAQWLYERAVERAAQIDRELLVRPAPQPTLLGHTDPPWALIGFFSHGYLLAPPLIS